MTNEELVALIQKGENVSENMGLLYEQNKGIICMIAKPYSSFVDMDDLLQEAYFALDAAAKAYNTELGNKFMTYAAYKIKVQFQRYVTANGYVKRIPAYMQDRIRQYHKFKKEFQQQHNFEPDETEIMKALNIKKKTLHDLEQIIYESKCSSLDNSIFDDGGGSLLDSVCGSSNMEDDIVNELTRQQLNCELWEQVKSLDDRQSMVIYEHYHDSKPLKEISDTLHLSQERTSQIKDAALEQLRKLGKIREIAEAFNYDSSAAFHGGISKFKEFGSSTVEYLALKHIEQEEKERTASDLFNQILQMV